MKYWIYHFVTFLLILPIRIFIRKIHIEGEENFPLDKPVILACNHPNSFLDGVIFEFHYHGKKKIYSLARGDAFDKPIANTILRSMRLLPIYRARDAKAEVARAGNLKTNEECYELFQKGNAILIFPEGIAYPEKDLRPLKKGTANIAMGMAERSNHELDLYIVPTALNYSSFGTLRRTVHITYGTPIRIQEYKDRIVAGDKTLSAEITQKIEDSLQANVVKTKEEFTDEKEFLHEVMLNENKRNIAYISKGSWKGSIKKANSITSKTAELIGDYKTELKKLAVLDANVNGNSFDYVSFIIALVTFAISLPVYLLWYLLTRVIVYYCSKKISNPVFVDSVIVGATMIFTVVLCILVLVFFLNTTPSWWPIVFTIASLYGALSWFRLMDDIPFLWKELKWLGLKDDVKEKLQNQRKAIFSLIAND